MIAVYCTARVSGIDDPSTPQDQDRYLRALEVGEVVDHIEYGNSSPAYAILYWSRQAQKAGR